MLSSAVTESMTIGISSVPNLKSTGVPALSGNVERIMSILSRTSLVATSMSVPYSNSSVTIERFSFDCEDMSLRSLTVLSVFSMILVTLVSISAALAPGYEVSTMIVLVSIFGNKSMERRVNEKRPITTTATKQRAVVMGFLTAVE